jgi:DNA gyrase subunit A
MAGISLSGDARAITFAVADAVTAVVATVSAADGTVEGLESGRGKVTALLDFPAKGRATGGVRAQTLGRGETGLRVAWVGPAPVLAAGADGVSRPFPDDAVRRDAPGLPLEARVDAFGTAPR